MNKTNKKKFGLKRKDSFNKKLALQVVFSIALVAAVIVTKQVNNEFSNDFIDVTEQKMTENMDIGKVKENFQNLIGNAVEKLPFVANKDDSDFAAPVNGTIKQAYGISQSEDTSIYNHGIEILSNTETVKSISNGVVSTVGNNDKLLNYVVVEEDNKTIIYGKISKILVEEGTAISKGDIIGALSENEMMLHLEVWEDGGSINPTKLFDMNN
jgi:septal ring factor EnvC (AmiA/AmiB activator)